MLRRRIITDIESVKLYYPFLRNHYGTREPLRYHINNIKTYLLLADSVIIPPGDFARGNAFLENRDFICFNSDFAVLIENGKILITTVDTTARDVADVIEYYSDRAFNMFPYSNLPVYYRDEEFQREKYTLHMIDAISSLNTQDDDKVEFISWLNHMPRHHLFLDKVKAADIDMSVKNDILKYTHKAYHCGGAWGNDAIVPPVSRKSIEAFYNQFYSITLLSNINSRFINKTGKNIADISASKLNLISNLLTKFHHDYYSLSQKYQKLSFKLDHLLAQDIKRWKLLKELIYRLISVTLGAIISKIFSPEIIANPLLIISTGIAAIASIELLKLGEKIGDWVMWFFKKIGRYNACKDDLLFALNEFDNSLRRIELG